MIFVKKPSTNRKFYCSHSFCKACFENLATQNEENIDGKGKNFDCPTCRSTVILQLNESVVGLPDNKFIVKLLTAVGPNRKQEVSVCCHPRCKRAFHNNMYGM